MACAVWRPFCRRHTELGPSQRCASCPPSTTVWHSARQQSTGYNGPGQSKQNMLAPYTAFQRTGESLHPRMHAHSTYYRTGGDNFCALVDVTSQEEEASSSDPIACQCLPAKIHATAFISSTGLLQRRAAQETNNNTKNPPNNP